MRVRMVARASLWSLPSPPLPTLPPPPPDKRRLWRRLTAPVCVAPPCRSAACTAGPMRTRAGRRGRMPPKTTRVAAVAAAAVAGVVVVAAVAAVRPSGAPPLGTPPGAGASLPTAARPVMAATIARTYSLSAMVSPSGTGGSIGGGSGSSGCPASLAFFVCDRHTRRRPGRAVCQPHRGAARLLRRRRDHVWAARPGRGRRRGHAPGGGGGGRGRRDRRRGPPRRRLLAGDAHV